MDYRNRLSIISRGDSRLKLRESLWKGYCCWCYDLQELSAYYRQLELEKTLPWDWDIEKYMDHKLTVTSEFHTRTILLFGKNSAIKEEFFRKMMVNEDVAVGSHELHVSEYGIKVGIKNYANIYKNGDGKLIFAEVFHLLYNASHLL